MPPSSSRGRQDYDFDAMFFNYTASLSPGVEQVDPLGLGRAGQPGTFNYAGVANPAVDAMIEALINARDARRISSTPCAPTTAC